ncbi:MAG: hypothetical protein WA728_31540, partial [Xanthobacteraceae bacterium]
MMLTALAQPVDFGKFYPTAALAQTTFPNPACNQTPGARSSDKKDRGDSECDGEPDDEGDQRGRPAPRATLVLLVITMPLVSSSQSQSQNQDV